MLTASGGFNATVLGIAVRSNNPRRVILVAVVALAGYFLAGGRIRRAHFTRLGRGSSHLLDAVIARPGLVAGAIAVALTGVAMAESTRTAGGADAYGYVSQAELWLSRDLVIERPWVAEVPWPDAEWSFSPLGYRPSPVQGQGRLSRPMLPDCHYSWLLRR